jgi:hypothetical protein
MRQTPTTTKHQSLWENLNGEVQCPKHMGYEASAEYRLAENPKLRRIETSMTVWKRMSPAAVNEWTEWIAEMYDIAEPCEGCRWEAKA